MAGAICAARGTKAAPQAVVPPSHSRRFLPPQARVRLLARGWEPECAWRVQQAPKVRSLSGAWPVPHMPTMTRPLRPVASLRLH